MVLEAPLLEEVLVAGLVVTTGVVGTDVVVTGVAELVDVLAAGLVALEAVEPVAEAVAPLLAGDADEGNPWASWLSPEERALAGLPLLPTPTPVTGLPVEAGAASAACCIATDSASNSAERNCVSAWSNAAFDPLCPELPPLWPAGAVAALEPEVLDIAPTDEPVPDAAPVPPALLTTDAPVAELAPPWEAAVPRSVCTWLMAWKTALNNS
ncbi:MAG: hypothetical protein WAU49_18520 [Steroidobacteraceae bacterium]